MLYCDTAEFAAVCAGTKKMKRADPEIFHLVEDLEIEIKHITTVGQIVLMVQHGWVSAIDASVRRFRKKQKTVD